MQIQQWINIWKRKNEFELGIHWASLTLELFSEREYLDAMAFSALSL